MNVVYAMDVSPCLFFLGQGPRKVALPLLLFSLLLVLSPFGKKYTFLLFNPCNCLLPYLLALELRKVSLSLPHVLIHANNSWKNIVLKYVLCAGSVDSWGYKNGPWACPYSAFSLVREIGKHAKEIIALVSNFKLI